MNLFFDNNFPPPLVRFLGLISERAGSDARYLHLRDVPQWSDGAPADREWIPVVCGWKERWAILTSDFGRKGADKTAWSSCTRPVLRFGDRFVNAPLWEQTKRIINSWEHVLEWAASSPSGSWIMRPGGGKIVRA